MGRATDRPNPSRSSSHVLSGFALHVPGVPRSARPRAGDDRQHAVSRPGASLTATLFELFDEGFAHGIPLRHRRRSLTLITGRDHPFPQIG